MTCRKRLVALKVGLGLMAASIALALGTRGLRVVVTNSTTSPLIDAELSHPGGTVVLPRIEPGASVARAVRRPLAGPWGRSREVPMALAFTQEGERSDPFEVRCELGWAGLRRVDLVAGQSKVDRSVALDATMIGHREVMVGRLLRNMLDPSIGPRRFYTYRLESTGAIVIRRRDWPREFAGRIGEFASVVSSRWRGPVSGPSALLEYAAHLRDERTSGPAPPRRLRLPFLDLNEAQADPRAGIVQSPLLP